MKNIYALLMVFVLAGCQNEEFFELDRPPQAPWQSVGEFELAAVSPYNLAFLDSWNNFYASDRVVDFIQSDLMHHLGNQEGFPIDALIARNTTQVETQQDGAFRDGYKVIGVCNAGLDFYAETEGNPFPTVSDFDRQNNVERIIGELHFLRAFTYFQLARRHCPPYDPNGANADRLLPLRLTFPKNVTEATQPEYATTASIYEQILADLGEAKSRLPESFVSGMHPSYQYGRATRFAAAMLLAQVHFQMGKWNLAKAELDYVIGSGKFQLEANPIDIFNRDQLGSESKEVIWYILYSDPKRPSPINAGPKKYTLINKSHYTAMQGGRGQNWSLCPWNQFTLSREALAKAGWMTDPLNGNYTETASARADKRYQQIYYRMEGYSSNTNANEQQFLKDSKYRNVNRPIVYSDRYYRAPFGNAFHLPIFRLAEAYLMRSIIQFRAGDAAAAAADLNMVAQRAFDTKLGEYVPVTAGNISEDRIDAEWIKELAGEGFRLQYLFAIRKPVGPGDRAADNPRRVIEPPYTNYYWLIPQEELDFR